MAPRKRASKEGHVAGKRKHMRTLDVPRVRLSTFYNETGRWLFGEKWTGYELSAGASKERGEVQRAARVAELLDDASACSITTI